MEISQSNQAQRIELESREDRERAKATPRSQFDSRFQARATGLPPAWLWLDFDSALGMSLLSTVLPPVASWSCLDCRNAGIGRDWDFEDSKDCPARQLPPAHQLAVSEQRRRRTYTLGVLGVAMRRHTCC